MIPMFWLETLVNVWATVIEAAITGGTPVLVIGDGHMCYAIEYPK